MPDGSGASYTWLDGKPVCAMYDPLLTSGPQAIRWARVDPSFNRWVFSQPLTGLYLEYVIESLKVVFGAADAPDYYYPPLA
jgi:hypothetical protein